MQDTYDSEPFLAELDRKAWELLGLSGEEFAKRWAAGLYDTDFSPEAVSLVGLIARGVWQAPRAYATSYEPETVIVLPNAPLADHQSEAHPT